MSRHSSPDCITGFVNIAKPADMTSQDAVSIVRGALTARRAKDRKPDTSAPSTPSRKASCP